MKAKLKVLISYIRASLGFIKTLLGPMDRTDSICPRGHSLLKNWDHCPACRTLNRWEECGRLQRLSKAKAPLLALFGLEGAHRGESLLINKDHLHIGCHPTADLVLTPENLNQTATYQMVVNGKINLSTLGKSFFRINGQTQQNASLFDFDEVEVLNNKFLVLDLRRKGISHDSH